MTLLEAYGLRAATRYRKRPVVVDAHVTSEPVEIETLEGTMHASPGDWIVTGTHGERYPVKPDVFAATYEPVAGDGGVDESIGTPGAPGGSAGGVAGGRFPYDGAHGRPTDEALGTPSSPMYAERGRSAGAAPGASGGWATAPAPIDDGGEDDTWRTDDEP